MAKLVVYKPNLTGLLGSWSIRHDAKPVFHRIIHQDTIDTTAGKMELVNLRERVELGRPEVDIATIVGYFHPNKTNVVEIWFWNDKFWVKAVDGFGVPWYKKDKCHLFIEIEIERSDDLLDSIKV